MVQSIFVDFYASAQRSVTGGIMVLCVRVCMCASQNIVNTISCGVLDTFLPNINDALWDRDEHFRIWGQKVKSQSHGGVKYAGNSTFWAC